MNLGIKGKIAIVTASSKGLGKASAIALAKEGATVVISARDTKVLENTAKEIKTICGGEMLAIRADVTKQADLEKLVNATIQKYKTIDILINNAGGPPLGTFQTVTEEQWKSSFELTLLSAIRMTTLVLPYMKKNNWGRIINMTGSSAKQPLENLILSNTFRPAVIGMAKTLAIETAGNNITVNNIATGYFLTDRVNKLYKIDEKLKQGSTEAEAVSNRGIPMKRFGRPEEFGALVAFLASKQSSYLTGTTIQIDGGMIRSLL